MLCFFLLGGRAAARSTAKELTALEVPRVSVIEYGQEHISPLAQIKLRDIVRLRPGSRMPVDGVIISGESEINRAPITEETMPVFGRPEMRVSAEETNLTGVFTLRVTAAGRDPSLHRMSELVALAETSRLKYVNLTQKAAAIYAPFVDRSPFAHRCGRAAAIGA